MKNFLLIENNADISYCIEYVVEDLGYQYLHFQSLLPVVQINKLNPDIILIDHSLPNGSGNKLCLELKQNLCTQKIPVVLMGTDPDIKNIAKDCFADYYLSMPFELDGLLNILSNLDYKALSTL